MQYRCVFTWGQVSDETIEFGDEEWSLGDRKRLNGRTFVEHPRDASARGTEPGGRRPKAANLGGDSHRVCTTLPRSQYSVWATATAGTSG